MGLWSKIKGEFIDIIEWTDDTKNTMVYRFERHGNEIKNGAKLTVREGQVAALVNEGKLADVYQPGMHTLETRNMPILSTLLGWKYGFSSPFKAECYFVSTRQFTDLKWGTKNPFLVRDPEFGALRIRAFGTYVIRVKDAAAFLRQIVGTDSRFHVEDITEDLRNTIVTMACDAIAESKVPVLDMAGNTVEFSNVIGQKIQPQFEQYGLELTRFRIENISLPPEVEGFIDKGSSMRMVGNLNQFTQFQVANSMEKAAMNPGGAAGAGVGMGAGMGMGYAMANQMGAGMQQAAQGGAGGPPPIPGATQYFVAVNGQQTGPFDAAQLRLHAQSGKLAPESLVWAQGMANWTKAREVAELAGSFTAGPPPIPPQ